jgi:NAD(P)-dependent dehydrogenase (short-subunit alcohol dehydrogenase family)
MDNAPLLIVGATRGIGRRTADLLIASGLPVITAGRTSDAPSGVVDHMQMDVTADDLGLSSLPDALGGLAYFPGSIDLRPIRGLKANDLRAAFELNAVGAFRVVQACADRLKRTPLAGIVLVSTVAVQRGMPFHVPVAMAKGAVEGLTRSLAAELAPTVRVNCIAPGLVRTDLSARLLDSAAKEKASAERHPLKRVGDPDDIAAMAAFLLGPSAGWITGQVIGVDGGLGCL